MSWNIAKPGDQINGSLVVTGTVTINSALTLGGNFTMTSGVGVITSTSDADTTNPLKLVNAGASGGTEVSFSLQPGSNAARLAQLAAVNDGSGNVTLHLRTSAAGAAANRLTILPAGNVGIGTASPANKLDVNGILSASSGIFGGTGASNITVGASGIYNGFVSNSSVYLVSDGGSASGLFAYGSTHATKPSVLELRSGSAVRATLDTTGNLGLSTTPSAWGSNYRALEISGAVNVFGNTGDANFAGLAANIYNNNSGYFYRYSTFATLYLQDNGQHQWHIAPAGTAGNGVSFNQAMVLNSSGNLAIGIGSATTRLTVSAAGAEGIDLSVDTAASTLSGRLFLSTGTSGQSYALMNNAGALAFHSGATPGASTGTERLRVDASGNLLVGTTSSAKGSSGSIFSIGTTFENIRLNGSGGSQTFQTFNMAATTVGSITSSTTTTSYNTSSDYRLKEEVQPLSGALNRVLSLKPVSYKWKSDKSDGEGFIAHELAEIVPLAVNGAKDAVDDEGKPVYQGVDYSKVVAVLTAAIQELTAEVQALKNA